VRSVRAAVDTQVWVRALLKPNGPAARVHKALIQSRFELVTSDGLLDELLEVLQRPAVARKHGRPEASVRRFVDDLRVVAHLESPRRITSVCRDPDDDLLIETAILGAVDALVREDQDVQASEVVNYLWARSIRVITVREFLAELDAEAAGGGGGNEEA